MFHERKSSYEQVERDARRLAQSIGELIGEKGDEGRHMTRQATDFTREQWEHARDVAREGGKRVDRYAHEHVWTTVGVAAAVGVVLGAILDRMMKR
jgi:ElaB/YqjD/DUF883 family membrane-anchored ribosome-binding protein